MRNILPINATKLELNIADIVGGIADLKIDIKYLWNADKCPAHLLPWLAHQFSVDIWDDEWDEDVKRQAIKTSISRHAIKGTRKSIVTALLTLGIVADVTAWHEFEVPKDEYTFEVIAWVTKQVKNNALFINAELHGQAMAMVDAHKSARDEFVLKIGAKFYSEIKLGAVATVQAVHSYEVDEALPMMAVDLNLIADANIKTIQKFDLPEVMPIMAAEAGVFAQIRSKQIINIVGEYV